MRPIARAALAVTLLALAAPRAARAEDGDDPLAGLSGARALETVKVLAAPAMKGRRTGTDGGRAAEDWVQSVMGELALDPMDRDGIYLQTFAYGAHEVVPPISLAIDGRALEYRAEFTDLGYGGDGVVEAEAVFVGYGITAEDRGWDDYAGVDVRGKVVLAMRGAPASRAGDFGAERLIGWKSSLAAEHGAAAFLLVDGASPVAGGTIQERWYRPTLPALWIGSAAADRVLARRGRTLDELRRTRDAGDPGRSFTTATTVRVEVHGRFAPNAQARNGLAGFHGHDPDVRGEVVLVGAHLDHLGVDPTGAVYPGADDDASGVAVMLEVARTLHANRWKPARTVVFCAFAGEEQGLAGSRRMVLDAPFPHDSVVAMLNLDAVGAGRAELASGGREAHPAFWARALSRAPAVAASLEPFRAEPTSDHWPFLERGIPALFLRTRGDHAHYHTPGDVADTVKPEVLEAAARTVGRLLVSIADDPAPYDVARLLPERLLTEGPRLVEGAAATKALDDWLDVAGGGRGEPGAGVRAAAARDALDRSGWTCVAVPLDEGSDGAALAWARLADRVRRHGDAAVIARSASDVTGAARDGRVVVLPRLRCAASAKALPSALSAYRDLGFRWVEPFAEGVPTTPAERDAVLAAARDARLVVDLTALDAESRAAARARLGDAPATVRVVSGDAAAVAAVRKALGPSTLVLLSGGAESAVLSAAALSAPEDGLAPAAVSEADSASVEARLAEAQAAGAALDEPDGPGRARARARLSGAFVGLLRGVSR